MKQEELERLIILSKYEKEYYKKGYNAIAGIEHPQYDDSEIVGRVEALEAVDHDQFLTEHQDISHLATKDEIPAQPNFEYKIEGFTIADILVWQMDHFRAHLDRSDSANRYDKDRLLLSTFETMLEMKKNPGLIIEQYSAETGIDLAEGWNIH